MLRQIKTSSDLGDWSGRVPSDLIDALLADYKKPEDLIGQDGLLKQLTKALVERALQPENYMELVSSIIALLRKIKKS